MVKNIFKYKKNKLYIFNYIKIIFNYLFQTPKILNMKKNQIHFDYSIKTN